MQLKAASTEAIVTQLEEIIIQEREDCKGAEAHRITEMEQMIARCEEDMQRQIKLLTQLINKICRHKNNTERRSC